MLGLLSVFVFTRLFSPHDYGIYLLGVGFAAVVSTFLVGWFRNLILSGHARNDGTDVRGLVISGYSICCLTAPIAYGLGRLVGLDVTAAMAAVVLSVAIGLFELTQDLVRARLLAADGHEGYADARGGRAWPRRRCRAVQPDGIPAAAFVSAGLSARRPRPVANAWRGTIVKFDAAGLSVVARQGLPLTLSLTLLAISSVTDRFMIANLVGAADAGRYVAGLDLVRQTLMIPAMSAAAAFFPLAVQIHASRGPTPRCDRIWPNAPNCCSALRCPPASASPSFPLTSPMSSSASISASWPRDTMPIVAIAVIFQILTQQYLHASFLLSGRNSFYLINTASIIAANVVLSYVLVSKYGTIGAAWARLGADVFGFACALVLSRLAFPIPIPLGRLALTLIAGLIMALTVGALDRSLHVVGSDRLLRSGAASGRPATWSLCWLLDISRMLAGA